ncbi:MAG: alpha-galactosidase [Bacteroidales bacterium]|nr:alpha-galactosidase [Bacteroidales bacterium]
MRRILTIAAAILLAISANAQAVITRNGIENPDKWINTYFAQGKVPPFSFAYEEISSGKFITDWRFSKKKITSSQKGAVEYLVTWTDPENTLRVSCNVRGYSDTKAVEWVVRFKNISRRNTPKIAVIKAADYKMSEESANGFTARYCAGCNGEREDFHTEEFDLRAGVIREFTPENGMSSSGASLPYYNVISRGADAGLVMAVGWTGRWWAELRGVTSLEYRMYAGLAKANFYLRPGEEVRTPLVATVFWKGSDPAAGENAFRRFVASHHSPVVAGRVWAPTVGGFDFGSPAPCEGNGCLSADLATATVKRYKQLGLLPELFLLEEGWNTAAGDWSPKEDLFPDGLSPVSDLIHSYGSRLMVHFAPENVLRGTPLTDKPEYLLMGVKKGDYIFDFSQPKALEHITKYIGDIMAREGIDALQCDVAGNLADYWDANDERDRTGIIEMKYVAGLYAFWDAIAKRFPQCALDVTAAGRRLDLEAVSRSAAAGRARGQKTEWTQCQQYCLNMFLPLQGAAAASSDPYDFRTCYGGTFTANYNLFERDSDSEQMKAGKEEYEAVRGYFLKDYYPLRGFTPLLHDDIWVAGQFHDAKTDSGIIVAFRRSLAENVTFAASLRGVKSDSTYELYNFDTGKTQTLSGSELAKGYKLSLPDKRSSILLKYKAR